MINEKISITLFFCYKMQWKYYPECLILPETGKFIGDSHIVSWCVNIHMCIVIGQLKDCNQLWKN